MYVNYLALNGKALHMGRCGPSDLRETVPLPRDQHDQNNGIPDDVRAFRLPTPHFSAPRPTNFTVAVAKTKVVPTVTPNIPIENV